ncbi:DUF6165 family protein [uncultured Rhodoblastus sp.]|uniref:DUF6165 family protein n=1 Tax=uncultured Rhodoblastus sp. TaxID=543037 RepID=UPI0025D9AAC5|nr:DUF6165 family protein [uncultured Rhodoblastus sp.]
MGTSILIPVSPGEYIDKLTILEIKRLRIDDVEKRRNVETEYAYLVSAADVSIFSSIEIALLRAKLLAINTQLWETEDKIRAYERRGDFGSAFVSLARAVYLANDERAEAKRKINFLLDSPILEEKFYTALIGPR